MARRTSKLQQEYDSIEEQIDKLEKEKSRLDVSQYSRPSYTSSDGLPELIYVGEDDAKYEEIEDKIEQLDGRLNEIENIWKQNAKEYLGRKWLARTQGFSVG